MDDCLEFECNPEMVVAARRFVHDRLTAWEASDHLDGAMVITSELVTNAVLHARTAVTLRVAIEGDRVRIEVFDENPRLPVMAPCPPDATSGRGLALVTALATSWGMENRDGGKVVWAEVGPPSRDNEPEDCVDLSGVQTVEDAFEHLEDGHSDSASS